MLETHPHRRLNLLTGEWVLVSPHRTQRPWQGQTEPSAGAPTPAYDPACYLCPGNQRAGGRRNPNYTSTFVFDNDFPALHAASTGEPLDEAGLLIARPERGICRVVCFTPDHNLTLSAMSQPAVEEVVRCWIGQFRELSALDHIRSVQIFENRGPMMGASNPHPHCQIWASESLPNELDKENRAQLDWSNRKGSCLLCDYLNLEMARQDRVVMDNGGFLAVIPFWAVWPFETLLISRNHRTGIDQFTESEQTDLAGILRALTAGYDALFQTPFPYTMGLHQRPAGRAAHEHFHFHAHFYPPLLRSATIRKFMVGFEMLGSPQRDITPEAAAVRLRAAVAGRAL